MMQGSVSVLKDRDEVLALNSDSVAHRIPIAQLRSLLIAHCRGSWRVDTSDRTGGRRFPLSNFTALAGRSIYRDFPKLPISETIPLVDSPLSSVKNSQSYCALRTVVASIS